MMMAVEDFLGIPYRLNGRDKTGVDCLGLVLIYMKSIGREIPDGDGGPVASDWRREAAVRIRNWVREFANPVRIPAAGDIAVFHLPGNAWHLGVMVDGENVLHVLENRPSMLTPLKRFGRRVVGVYRPKAMINVE